MGFQKAIKAQRQQRITKEQEFYFKIMSVYNYRILARDHKNDFPRSFYEYPSKFLAGHMTAQEWEAFVGKIAEAREPIRKHACKDCLAGCCCFVGLLGFFLIVPPLIGCYFNTKSNQISKKLHVEFEETYKKILADHSDLYEERGISFSQQFEKYEYDKGYDRDDNWRGRGKATRKFLVVTLRTTN